MEWNEMGVIITDYFWSPAVSCETKLHWSGPIKGLVPEVILNIDHLRRALKDWGIVERSANVYTLCGHPQVIITRRVSSYF